jgi:hypothetical protein
MISRVNSCGDKRSNLSTRVHLRGAPALLLANTAKPVAECQETAKSFAIVRSAS